jgi:hypothetical protein
MCVLIPTRVSCDQCNGLLQQDGAVCEESDFKDVLFSQFCGIVVHIGHGRHLGSHGPDIFLSSWPQAAIFYIK